MSPLQVIGRPTLITVRAFAALALVVLAGAGCAARDANAPTPPTRVWSERTADYVEPADVVAAVAGARLVLLGETHDIEMHHRLQARLVDAAAGQRRPAVVFEMIRRDQQPAIARWRENGADPARFGEAVDWGRRGWPEWSMYQPIVETALAHDLPILGGAPPSRLAREVGHAGLGALTAKRRRELRIDRPLPEAGRARLVATLRNVHCNVDSESMVTAMLAVQRLRDAFLAERLREAAGEHGAAVLIAGRGHTRSDHGVPVYLDDAGVVAVGFAGTGEFEDLEGLRAAQGGTLGHDYIWLTPGGEPVPGCEPRQDNG